MYIEKLVEPLKIFYVYMLRRIYEIAYFMKAATLSPNTCNRQFGYQIHKIRKF
jgi:hypothetical protein